MRKLLLLIVIATTIFACKKESLEVYNNKASGVSIYFPAKESDLGGNIDFSFGYEKSTLTDTTLKIVVRIIGSPTNEDRPYKLKIEDGSTMTSDMYKFLNPLVIPAGKVADTLLLHLSRTAAMRSDSFFLYLGLQENENFTNRYDSSKVTAGSGNVPKYYTHIRIAADDMAGAPGWWRNGSKYYTTAVNYLGKFSTLKFQLLITYYDLNSTELIDPDWMGKLGNASRASAWANGLKAYLTRMTGAGTPVLEADGTPMTMGIYAR